MPSPHTFHASLQPSVVPSVTCCIHQRISIIWCALVFVGTMLHHRLGNLKMPLRSCCTWRCCSSICPTFVCLCTSAGGCSIQGRDFICIFKIGIWCLVQVQLKQFAIIDENQWKSYTVIAHQLILSWDATIKRQKLQDHKARTACRGKVWSSSSRQISSRSRRNRGKRFFCAKRCFNAVTTNLQMPQLLMHHLQIPHVQKRQLTCHSRKVWICTYFLEVSWTTNGCLRIRHLQNNVCLHHTRSTPPCPGWRVAAWFKKQCAAPTVGLLCSSSRLEAISLQLAKSLPTWVQIGCVESDKDKALNFQIYWGAIILLEEVHSSRISTENIRNVSCICQISLGTAFILHRNFGHAFCFHNLWRELAVGSPCDDLNMHVTNIEGPLAGYF